MNCNDVRTYLDRRLPGDPADGTLDAHLAHCAECRAHADALALVDARLGGMFGRLDAPPDFGARLAARIAQEAERDRRMPERGAVDSELGTWLARARRESLLDLGSLVGGGLAALYAAAQFAPAVGRWFEHVDGGQNALVIGALAAAGTLAAAWVAVGDARRALFAK